MKDKLHRLRLAHVQTQNDVRSEKMCEAFQLFCEKCFNLMFEPAGAVCQQRDLFKLRPGYKLLASKPKGHLLANLSALLKLGPRC